MQDEAQLKKLSKVVNSETWFLFLEWLEEEERQSNKLLRNSSDMEMYRQQGRAQYIEKLKNLRSTVSNRIKDFRNG